MAVFRGHPADPGCACTHKKGLELVCHVQPNVPDALVGEAGRLRQVLLNLVGNAVKFTDEGEVVVGVEIQGDNPPPSPGAGDVGLRFSVKRVIRYLRANRCPDWNLGRRRPTQLDSFAGTVDAWITQGGRNAAERYRELFDQGCRASYDAVRRFVDRRLGSTGRPVPRVGRLSAPASPVPPSARQLSFAFIRPEEERTEAQRRQVECLQAGDGALQVGLQLAAAFAALVRKTAPGTLGDWLALTQASGCAELRSFAASLRQDEAAVAAAVSEDWSNGPVEGHVNRLKLLKRSMYGRASLKLLRARVRQAKLTADAGGSAGSDQLPAPTLRKSPFLMPITTYARSCSCTGIPAQLSKVSSPG